MSVEATSKFNNLGPDHLSNLSEQQVRDLISGDAKRANQLYSEELSGAQIAVNATGDKKMVDAFEKFAFAAMTGKNADPGGNGFTYRNDAGAAIKAMLHNGDTTTFDRMLDYNKHYGGWESVQPHVELLMARLEVHCAKKGIETHTRHTPGAPKAAMKKDM